MEGHQAQACLEVEAPVLGLVFLALKVLVDLRLHFRSDFISCSFYLTELVAEV